MTQTPSKISISVRNKSTGEIVTSEGVPVPDHHLIFGDLAMFARGETPLPVADFGSAHLTRPHLEDAPLADWSPTRVNRRTGGSDGAVDVEVRSGVQRVTGRPAAAASTSASCPTDGGGALPAGVAGETMPGSLEGASWARQ